MWVFHNSVSWWAFTEFREQVPSGFNDSFLYSSRSQQCYHLDRVLHWFTIPPFSSPGSLGLFRVWQSQLVSPSASYSTVFLLFFLFFQLSDMIQVFIISILFILILRSSKSTTRFHKTFICQWTQGLVFWLRLCDPSVWPNPSDFYMPVCAYAIW